MNREEAAREIDNTACCFSDKRFRNAMHMAADALRGEERKNRVAQEQNKMGSGATQTDTQHSKNLTLRADVLDAPDRLRWIAAQAERAGVRLDPEDHAAVTLACDALEGRIDKAPGFDSVRR